MPCSYRVLLGLLRFPPAANAGSLPPCTREEVVQCAKDQGVAALAYDRLKTRGPGDGDAQDYILGLKPFVLKQAWLNVQRYQDLALVLGELDRARIPALVLKGGYLAVAVYGDPALRHMDDVDLLVPEDQINAAFRRLSRFTGEAAADSPSGLSEFHDAAVLVGRTGFELHWALESAASGFAIDTPALFRRARVFAPVPGLEARTLSPEDMLLHLCLHTGYHHGRTPFSTGLRSLMDLALLLEGEAQALDWNVVAARAGNWGMRRIAWLVLKLAARLLGSQDASRHLDVAVPPEGAEAHLMTAADLLLSTHYDDLEQTYPSVAQVQCRRDWVGGGRTHTLASALWPSRADLANLYPRFTGRYGVPAAYLPRWWDCLGEYARYRLSREPETRRLRHLENRRAAMLAWLRAGSEARTR